jgi:hypothetical protein
MQKVSQNSNILKLDIEDKVFDEFFNQNNIALKLGKISDKLDDL